MGLFADLFANAFRSYATNGVPSSGNHEPRKGDIIPIGGELDNAIDGAAAGNVLMETWTALNATPGTRGGQPGYVKPSDGGTHTDPVVGGTVNNAGEYRWSTSPAGWKRIGDYYALDIDDIGDLPVPISLGGTGASTAVGGHDAFSTRASTVASASTIDLDAATGHFVPISGSTNIEAVTLSDGRWRFGYFSGNLTIVVSGTLVGDNGGANVPVSSGDMALFQGSSGGVVRFRLFRAARGVTISAGTDSAGNPILLTSTGNQHYSTLPTLFQIFDSIGPLNFGGDGRTAVWAFEPDGTFNNPDFRRVKDAAYRPLPIRRVGAGGDSRADLCSKVVNGMTQTTAMGWLWWLQTRMRGRLDFWDNAQNHGEGGSYTEALIGQALAILAAEKQPCLVFLFSSTNDRAQGWDGQRSVDNISTAVDLLTMVGGHRVVVFADQPKGDSSGVGTEYTLTGNDLAWHFETAQGIRRMGERPGVLIADPWPYLADPLLTNGRAKNGLYYDQLHNGPPGAALTAQAALDVLDDIVPPRNVLISTNGDIYSTNNARGSLVGNPLLAGSVTSVVSGVTGVLPTGWTVAIGSGLTATTSKVAASDGGPDWFQVVMGGSPSGTSTAETETAALDASAVAFRLYRAIDPSDLSFGDTLEATAEIELDAGSANLRGIPLYLKVTVDGTEYTVCSGEPAMGVSPLNLNFPATSLEGVLMTPRLTIPEGTISAARVEWEVVGRQNSGAGAPFALTATARIRFVAPRKVI